ncbi:MAG: isoaspartyl peptidase/L-asparaginase family protein [Chloroflexota bacterium]
MIARIMAHGGAWDWEDDLDAEKKAGLEEAVAKGYALLKSGRSALEAVEATVISLEDNPVFDAGTGGYLNQDGVVQLDALIVDGSSYNFGAVGGVSRVKNPITLARKIMTETDFCFFVGDGADRMAKQLGITLVENARLVTPEMNQFYRSQQTDGPSDTVGAVVIDAQGNVAAATSTSGTPYKPVGRVGDSPLLGAGGFAENGVGATGATGKGENSMRVLLSKYTCDKLATGFNALDAAQAAMQYVERIIPNSMSGVIVVDAQGNLGAAHTTPKLAFGWVDQAGVVRSATNANQLMK